MKKRVYLNDASDVILLYEVLRNSKCKAEMTFVDDFNLTVDFLDEQEELFIDALTVYSLIALVDEIVFGALPGIDEEQFISFSSTVVYDEELNNIVKELLVDYFSNNFNEKNEARLKLHGFRNFNMYNIIPLIHDYVKDFTENEINEDSIVINGERFDDELLLEITVFFDGADIWAKLPSGEDAPIESILEEKQIFVDIEKVLDGADDPITEVNAIYLTSLALIAGTEVIHYYEKDKVFISRVQEIMKENKLSFEFKEIK